MRQRVRQPGARDQGLHAADRVRQPLSARSRPGLSRAAPSGRPGQSRSRDRGFQHGASSSIPSSRRAYLNRALSWSEKDEHDRAIADYDAAIQLSPRDAGRTSAARSSGRSKATTSARSPTTKTVIRHRAEKHDAATSAAARPRSTPATSCPRPPISCAHTSSTRASTRRSGSFSRANAPIFRARKPSRRKPARAARANGPRRRRPLPRLDDARGRAESGGAP